MSAKRWSYRQITEHTERQIRKSMKLAEEFAPDAYDRSVHRLFAWGAYHCWYVLTQGWQEPGDDARLEALCKFPATSDAADSVKTPPA